MDDRKQPAPKELVQNSVDRLLSDLPLPVQQFLTSPERDAVSLRLSRKYELHADHAGAFEEAYIFMLLGVFTPQEFVQSLQEAGLSPAQITGLAEDINREVFLKLRAVEQGDVVNTQPVPPTAPLQQVSTKPATSVSAPTQGVRHTPRTAPPPPNLPGQVVSPPAPRPAPPPPPRIEVPVPPPAPPAPPQSQAPASDENTRIIHTMARDMQALKSGQDPFRVAHPAPPAWAAAPSAPVAPPVPAQPAPSAPTPPPAPEPVHETPPAHNEPLRAHLKQYGVDPYREPVE